MKIRKTEMKDFETVMAIYARARAFMAANGNPNQWGPTNWPPEDYIRRDIATGKGYVCLNEENRVIGCFFYDFGKDVEPGYLDIEQGRWGSDAPYGVVHRIAADGTEKGTGAFCIDWAFRQCGHLRIDTHGDNKVMQNLLAKLGFTYRGIIHVPEDDYPRLAYEKG